MEFLVLKPLTVLITAVVFLHITKSFVLGEALTVCITALRNMINTFKNLIKYF